VLAADLLRHYWMLHRHDHGPRSSLIERQARELASLRAHAYKHASFYRRFHAGLQAAPLRNLAVLSKAVLMEHFDEIVTDPTLRLRDLEQHLSKLESDHRFGGYWVNATSGSTGRRGIFVFDRAEWTEFLASWLPGRTLQHPTPQTIRARRLPAIDQLRPCVQVPSAIIWVAGGAVCERSWRPAPAPD